MASSEVDVPGVTGDRVVASSEVDVPGVTGDRVVASSDVDVPGVTGDGVVASSDVDVPGGTGDHVVASSEVDVPGGTVVSSEDVVMSDVNVVSEKARDMTDVKIPADIVVIPGVEYVVVVTSSGNPVVDCCITLIVSVEISSTSDVTVTSCEVDVTENSDEAFVDGNDSSVVTSAPDVAAKRVAVSEEVVTSVGILDTSTVVVTSPVGIPVDGKVVSAVEDDGVSKLVVDIALDCVVSVVATDETVNDVEVVVMTSVVDTSLSADGLVTSGEILAADNVVVSS